MRDPLEYRYQSTAYVFVRARASAHDAYLAKGWLPASRADARWVLEAMLLRNPALFEDLCRALDGQSASVMRGFRAHSLAPTDRRVDRLLAALGLEQHLSPHGAPAFASLRLLRQAAPASASLAASAPDRDAIDRCLAQLGDYDLLHLGHAHQLSRAGAARHRAGSSSFETMGEADLLTVLEALAADSTREPRQRDALAELLTIARRQRERHGRTDIVLLRRVRSYVRQVEEAPSALTPSQARNEGHWVEILTIDANDVPVSGVSLELVFSDGSRKQLRTNDEGSARAQPVPPGEVKVRLPALDRDLWKPLEGAAATDTGLRGAARTHVAKRGDCLHRIAHAHGLASWKALWDHPHNEPLRKKRKDPNVLLPGDQVVVPGTAIFELTRSIDAMHRIQVSDAAETTLRLRLTDMDHEPFADVSYDLSFTFREQRVARAGAKPTDASGWLQERVPLVARDVVVHLRKPALSIAVSLGHLDPLADEHTEEAHLSGAQQRLAALGYGSCDLDALEGSAALLAFQARELEHAAPTGKLCPDTLSALQQLYGV